MELKQLKYIMQIHASKTMSEASKKLFISQPALTRSLQSLEEELGVTLFDRVSNRLILNEYGKIVIEEAESVFHNLEEMKTRIQKQYNLNTCMCIGSCAPAPLWAIKHTMQKYYPSQLCRFSNISDAEELINDLNNQTCSGIILDYPMYRDDLVCFKICEETLNISIAQEHPFITKQSTTFKELNGLNFLEYSNTGYWHEVCITNMPQSHFIIQNNLELYNILQNQSSLLTFRTSLTIPRFHLYENRTYIPVTDPEATLSFYFICTKQAYKKIAGLETHLPDIDWIHYREDELIISDN